MNTHIFFKEVVPNKKLSPLVWTISLISIVFLGISFIAINTRPYSVLASAYIGEDFVSQEEMEEIDGSSNFDFGIIFPAKVIRVLDGDTVEVEVKKVIRIRMLDCWAPETRTKDLDEKRKGLESKNELSKVVMNKDVSIQIPISADGKFGDSMSMGRVLGRVIDRKTRVDYSVYMVKNGYATKNKEKK